MNRFPRRRLPGRKLARPSRLGAAAPAPTPPPIDVPRENPANGDSTEFTLPSVPKGSGDTTVEMPSVPADLGANGEALPPRRLEFACPCGATLVATRETYDKHSRCAMCQTVLLVNLVYDPEHHSHEIVPFRVDPTKPI